MGPDITVVVPVRNEAARLEICLRNLRRQSLEADRFEIVVVDDGSRDGSREAALKHKGVRVLREDGSDPYLARNAGVRAAEGSVIAFTDAHCAADEEWLLRIWRAFFEDGADLTAGPLAYPDGVSRLLRLYGIYHQAKLAYIYSENIESGMFCHAANLAVRKSVFEELGCFRPLPIPGDTELVHRLKRERPAAVVRYLPDGIVRRQSVGTFRELLQKTGKHAEYNHQLVSVRVFRTLSWKDRAKVYADCRRERNLSGIDSILLLYTLVAGVLAFEFGQLRERICWS